MDTIAQGLSFKTLPQALLQRFGIHAKLSFQEIYCFPKLKLPSPYDHTQEEANLTSSEDEISCVDERVIKIGDGNQIGATIDLDMNMGPHIGDDEIGKTDAQG